MTWVIERLPNGSALIMNGNIVVGSIAPVDGGKFRVEIMRFEGDILGETASFEDAEQFVGEQEKAQRWLAP